MEFTLIPLIVLIIGLLLFILPIGAKANRIGEIMILAAFIGICLGHAPSVSIK